MAAFVLIMSCLFVLVGLLIISIAFQESRRRRLIADIPSSRVNGIALGLVEVQGTAAADAPVKAPFSGKECVYARCEIATRIKKEHGSDRMVIARAESKTPFFLEDGTGRVLIDPKGAEIHIGMKESFEQRIDAKERFAHKGLKLIQEQLRAWEDSPHERPDRQAWELTQDEGPGFFLGETRQIREWRLDVGEQFYVMGTALRDSHAPNGVIIGRGENERFFFISSGSEKNAAGRFGGTLFTYALGSSFILFGALFSLIWFGFF